MNRFKIISAVVFLLLCTACSRQQDKRLVKLVTVDSENVSVYYYDYSSEKPAYKVEQKTNSGIRNTFTALLSENQYDLKLCRYAVCTEDVLKTEIENLVFSLTDSRFSPDIAIVQGDVQKWQDYIEKDTSLYPLYSLEMENNNVSGVIENIDNNTKNIVKDSYIYKTLPHNLSTVADIVGKISKSTTYTFYNDDRQLSADLENIMVYCTVKDNVALINIDAFLKSYRGMAANKEARKQFTDILQQSLQSDILDLYSDRKTAECLGLLWFEKLGNFAEIEIRCNIR